MQYRIFSISLLICLFSLTAFAQKRPHGPSRYGESNLQELNSAQKVYYFDIIEKQPRTPFKQKKVLPDVFSWGKLSETNKSKPILFRVRNTTKFPLFITDISNSSKDVFYSKTSDLIKVDTNEYLEVEVRFNPLVSGHFYCSMVIAYQNRYGPQEFSVRQWGFRESSVTHLTSIDSLFFKTTLQDVKNKRKKPIRFYISDEKFNIRKDLTITLRSKERVVYPKMMESNGEVYFNFESERSLWDSLFIQVVNADNKIISKSVIDLRRFAENNVVLFTFPEKWEPPYYYLHSQPVFYEPLIYVYQLAYNFQETDKFQIKDINVYLKKKGINVQADGRGFVFTQTMDEALKLDKRLASLNYQIKLLPVFHYSTIDQNGWGGDCSWLSDVVEIRFYKSIPQKRRMELLKGFDFIRSYKPYGSTDLVYYVRLGRMLDRKYIKQLDALYQVTEVKSIGQQMNGIAGLD